MRGPTIKTAGAMAAGAALLLCATAPSRALDCPVPQAAGQAGVIAETPDQIRELSKVFAAGGGGAQIPVMVAELQKRYPDAEAAAVANYLITAYCPSVRDAANLSEAEKTEKLSAFAKQVLKYLY
jgi:hypothetical protein